MRLGEGIIRILGFDVRMVFFPRDCHKNFNKMFQNVYSTCYLKKNPNTPTNTQNRYFNGWGLTASGFPGSKKPVPNPKLSRFEHNQTHLFCRMDCDHPFSTKKCIAQKPAFFCGKMGGSPLWSQLSWFIMVHFRCLGRWLSTILVYNVIINYPMFRCHCFKELPIPQTNAANTTPQPPASSTLCTHDSPRNTRRDLSCRFATTQTEDPPRKKTQKKTPGAGARPQHSTNDGVFFWSIRGLAQLQSTHTILWSSNNLSSRKGRHCNGVSTF